MLRIRLRAIVDRPFRTLVTVAMVAVCSTLAVSVAGLVTSVSGTADRVAAQVAGVADLEVAPAFSGGTVPDAVVDEVAAVPGVAAVAPTIQSTVTVDGTRALLVAGDAAALRFQPPDLATALTDVATSPTAGPATGSTSTSADPGVAPRRWRGLRGPAGVGCVRHHGDTGAGEREHVVRGPGAASTPPVGKARARRARVVPAPRGRRRRRASRQAAWRRR